MPSNGQKQRLMADQDRLNPFPTAPQPTSWYYGQAEIDGETMVVLTVYTVAGVQVYYLHPPDAAMIGAALLELGRAGNLRIT